MFTETLADNLVRCAAGKATLDYIEKNDLIRNAKDLGSYIQVPGGHIRGEEVDRRRQRESLLLRRYER